MMADDFLVAPNYCHYADGPCDQSMPSPPTRDQVFFVYPSDPETIAYTVEAAIKKLKELYPQRLWHSWKSMCRGSRKLPSFDHRNSPVETGVGEAGCRVGQSLSGVTSWSDGRVLRAAWARARWARMR